jgi:hypothetical protein
VGRNDENEPPIVSRWVPNTFVEETNKVMRHTIRELKQVEYVIIHDDEGIKPFLVPTNSRRQVDVRLDFQLLSNQISRGELEAAGGAHVKR